MKKQTQVFENATSKPLEIYIEVYPDLYVLQPKDEMQITYDHEGDGYGLHTIIHEDGLQIFLQEFDTAVVMINGTLAEPLNRRR